MERVIKLLEDKLPVYTYTSHYFKDFTIADYYNELFNSQLNGHTIVCMMIYSIFGATAYNVKATSHFVRWNTEIVISHTKSNPKTVSNLNGEIKKHTMLYSTTLRETITTYKFYTNVPEFHTNEQVMCNLINWVFEIIDSL